jgi:hypothetical protein
MNATFGVFPIARRPMRRLILLVAALFVSFTVPGAGEEMPDSRAAMERLKTLVGNWEMIEKGRSGRPHPATYALTGRGSVLIEDAGGMMTAYHLDHDQLVLTHFCGAGNQPRMRIKAADQHHIYFEMYDITNLASPQAYHSTSLDVVFVSEERIELVYGGTSDGHDSAQTFQLTRQATRSR